MTIKSVHSNDTDLSAHLQHFADYLDNQLNPYCCLLRVVLIRLSAGGMENFKAKMAVVFPIRRSVEEPAHLQRRLNSEKSRRRIRRGT
jgi:hypothetical protein